MSGITGINVERGQLGKKETAPAKDNRVREPLAKFWMFRITASKVGSRDQLIIDLKELFSAGRLQLEAGEGGIPHYQCALHTAMRKRRHTMRRELYIRYPQIVWPEIDYFEPMKSAKGDEYCMKEESRVDGPWEWNMPKVKIDMSITEDYVMQYDELPQWAQKDIDMVAGKLPDKKERTIYWRWSRQGEMYKTEFARHLVYYHDACVIQGGRKHVLATAYANPAPIYILVVPRSDEGFVSYASIELLKDALYMSAFGTKATGPVNRKKPWVMVVANFSPDEEAMSAGRFCTLNVDTPGG